MGMALEQQFDERQVSAFGGEHEGGSLFPANGVGVGPLFQQELRDFRQPQCSGFGDGSVAVVVGLVKTGSLFDEQVQHECVLPLHSGQQRRGSLKVR